MSNDSAASVAPSYKRKDAGIRIAMPGGLQLHGHPRPDLNALATRLWPGTPGLGLSALLSRAVLCGADIWGLQMLRGDVLLGGAFAVLERGRINARLTVLMVNELPGGDTLIGAVERFAAKLGVTALLLERVSMEAPPSLLPALKREGIRYSNEHLYIVDLAQADLEQRFARRTKTSISKACKLGLTVATHADEAAIQAHFACTDASLMRREGRGENVALRSDQDRVRRLIECGHGRLFQSQRDGQVLSSTVVLILGRHAHYYDSGSTAEGMALGASQFLMSRIIDTLREDGMQTFNLEIASAGNTGLMRYKEGFAPQLWFVERVAADRASPWRKLRNLMRRR